MDATTFNNVSNDKIGLYRKHAGFMKYSLENNVTKRGWENYGRSVFSKIFRLEEEGWKLLRNCW